MILYPPALNQVEKAMPFGECFSRDTPSLAEMKAMPTCLTCKTPVNKGLRFCELHVIVAKKETPQQMNVRKGMEQKMAVSATYAKEHEEEFLKKQEDGMEAAAEQKKKAKRIGREIRQSAVAIANLVVAARVLHPGTNAGSHGTQGGTGNPMAIDRSDWGDLTMVQISPHIKGFDDSLSGRAKIRVHHADHQDVLVHI